MLRKINQFASSPWVTLGCGLIILGTSGTEIIRTFYNQEIGAHHGMAVFGFLQIIKTLPELITGIQDTTEMSS